MVRFLAGRALALVITLLAATLVVFLVLNVVPGDPAAYMMGLGGDPAALAELRRELGLDLPVWQRYFAWAGGLAMGDFGVSYTYRVPVGDLILERMRVTLPLTLMAMALSTALAIPLALFAAGRRGRAADAAVSGLAQVGLAIPNFWLAILLVFVFSTTLKLFSAGGFPGWEAGVWPALKALVLPAVALALPQAAVLTRVARGALIETMGEDYIRTARAKGLSERRALRDHALRNAMIPVITTIGLQVGVLMAGAILTETIFSWPGIGKWMVDSVFRRDYPVIQGGLLIIAGIIMLVNLGVDLLYGLINPRIRH